MKKSEFIEKYSATNGITVTEGEKYVNSFIKLIYSTLKEGDRVLLSGFGTFSVAHRAKRIGVNPREWTEKIVIPAHNAPKFQAGQAFKDQIKRKAD